MRRRYILTLAVLICLSLFILSCRQPEGHPPHNPTMIDRTEGWSARILLTEGIYLLDIDDPFRTNVLFTILRSANEQYSFQTTISSEADAVQAMKSIIWNQYGITKHK